MNYKQIGDIGQNCAIGELSKYGLGISFPLSDNYPFDFIVIAKNNLFKTQVRTSTRISSGSISFDFTKKNFYSGERSQYSKEEIDVMACYDLVNHFLYILEQKDFCGISAFNIRFEKPKNNQVKGCHMHEDFILSKDRIKKVFNFEPIILQNYYASIKNIKQHKHICQNCTKEFSNGNKFAKYCSSDCYYFARRLVKRPTKEALMDMLVNKSLRAIGKQFGVTDNAVRKWVEGYGLPL
jgi:hypothetical protein